MKDKVLKLTMRNIKKALMSGAYYVQVEIDGENVQMNYKIRKEQKQ